MGRADDPAIGNVSYSEPMTIRTGDALRDAIDRMVCSRTNYWVAMVIDLVAAPAFLVVGVRRFSGSAVLAVLVVVAAFLAWGLFEYVLHRWGLHGPFLILRRGHAKHHAAPRALISTPLFLVALSALAVWGLLRVLLPAGIPGLAVGGLYVGYNYFALIHHAQHHHGRQLAAVARWKRGERFHLVHHHQQAVNFGITTTLWDRVFGTYQAVGEPAVTRAAWSAFRLYWVKLMRRTTATS